ncbi:MAG: LacI family DNA-binding transcriptional regulator [Phycisphaeraceae bacterium]
MATTIQDIAKELNISHVAVSNALRGTGRLGVDTRERVIATAKKMGYRPHAHARAIRSGRFGCVGLLLTTVAGRSTLTEGLVCGIHDALAEQNLHLIITRLPDDKLAREGVVPKTLREAMVDGFLVNYTDHIPTKMRQLIREYHLPVIWINVDDSHDCVHPDDHGAGRDLTAWLLEQGHKRIAYADYAHTSTELDEAHYSTHARQAGYEQAMADAGLKPRVIRPDRLLPEPQIESHVRSLLNQPDRPTAIITYGERGAAPAVFVARLLGLAVPDDLAVASFADGPMRFGGVHLPTWLVPQDEVGHEASRMLMHKINQRDKSLPTKTVPFRVSLNGETPPAILAPAV